MLDYIRAAKGRYYIISITCRNQRGFFNKHKDLVDQKKSVNLQTSFRFERLIVSQHVEERVKKRTINNDEK